MPAATLADAAGRDIVFTSLPDDKVLAAVALSGGLFDAMREGAILVETSTVSPTISAEVARLAAKHRVAYLRAPVSGNAAIARPVRVLVGSPGPATSWSVVCSGPMSMKSPEASV